MRAQVAFIRRLRKQFLSIAYRKHIWYVFRLFRARIFNWLTIRKIVEPFLGKSGEMSAGKNISVFS